MDNPMFGGVYMRDEIPILNKHIIINLDSSDGSGTHWTAVYWTRDKMFYFDSFGLLPPEELIGNRRIIANTSQIQDSKYESCGYYCVMFIEQMDKISYYDFINQFDPKPTKRNEQIVKNYFK